MIHNEYLIKIFNHRLREYYEFYLKPSELEFMLCLWWEKKEFERLRKGLTIYKALYNPNKVTKILWN